MVQIVSAVLKNKVSVVFQPSVINIVFRKKKSIGNKDELKVCKIL